MAPTASGADDNVDGSPASSSLPRQRVSREEWLDGYPTVDQMPPDPFDDSDGKIPPISLAFKGILVGVAGSLTLLLIAGLLVWATR